MNGERIFMWYARSYVQLKRLTGPDWGGTVSSFDYLQRSVPQFLVRYLREEYVPDAVMIYGAYVDNAAIPQNADAPAIDRWNKEYEFPKLIVATDSRYFRYIEEHFAQSAPCVPGRLWRVLGGRGRLDDARHRSEPPDPAIAAGGGDGGLARLDLRATESLPRRRSLESVAQRDVL